VVLDAVSLTRLPEPLETVIPARRVDVILHANEAVDSAMEARIAHWIDRWTGSGSRTFQRDLERAARYGPWVEAALEARGLPPSLRALPIVESGYNPVAISPGGAGGLWQIMPPTARVLGLRVDASMDERRDVLRSTEAALDYLTRLHEMFGSWFLALAAYNAGDGRVRQVLQGATVPEGVSGDFLYSRMRTRFPAVTQDFVPRFLAAARLIEDPERYGLQRPAGVQPWAFDQVEVPPGTSLEVVAQATGATVAEIRALNPQILRGSTPSGMVLNLRVPSDRPGGSGSASVDIPAGEAGPYIEHRVISGETLLRIANRYGISVRDLERSNPGVDPRRLQIGQRLRIPTG
jgi:membrane-bound lytic murein transglycosylase D